MSELNPKLHIVTVVAVVRSKDRKYLVLKRHDREKVYPGMFTFPGGKMEGNETVDEALSKEVWEEAGLKLKPGKLLLKDKSILRPDGQTSKSFSYLCEIEGSDVVKVSRDFTDFRWVSVSDLATLPHVGIEEELLKAEEIYALGVSVEKLQTKSVRAVLQ
ncbi:MAG: NUDIX hydrolase [Candidatus Doudnabacteria bacterium]|nr:NUDIX hydrolase [Candidatus Doudnabacteria bacterium]